MTDYRKARDQLLGRSTQAIERAAEAVAHHRGVVLQREFMKCVISKLAGVKSFEVERRVME